jgi:hypothetical protein
VTSILTLHRAVKTRLGQMVNTPVYEGDATPTATVGQYAILFPSGGHGYGDRVSGQQNALDWRIAVMFVGRSVPACLDAVTQGRNLLLGWDPDPVNLAGTYFTEDENNPPILPAKSVEGDVRYSITPTYRLTTDR